MVNLLLIEDDLPFGKMIQNFLSRNSYHVTIAYNGATAWQYCQDNSFQIILCDLRLPDSNGIDLMTQIKTIIPEIPFVLMTGYADVSTAVTAIKKGAADYISKPFVPEEMLLILENAIQNQQKSKKQKPSSIKSISNETLFGNSVASSTCWPNRFIGINHW
jgi:two-component system response regulator HydG